MTTTPAAPLMRRSRNGCIDCRRAKVKCDEIRPSCGTCARRRHVCQGYAIRSSAAAAAAATTTARTACRTAAAASTSTQARPETPGSGTGTGTGSAAGSPAVTPSSGGASPGRPGHGGGYAARGASRRGPSSSPPRRLESDMTVALASPRSSSPGSSSSPGCRVLGITGSSRSNENTLVGSLSLIPRGAVSPADASNIETYFKRHPFELLMGDEFVNEMNANVLLVLQHDPVPMADALSAIGYAYLAGDSPRSLMLVLNRRARILANLRTLRPSSCYFEQALFLLLVLCAMELVTLAQPGHEATIPTILTNVSSLIGHHLSTGGEISFVGRYLLRALARQDLVVSLVQMRRPRIPTYAWLDMTESHKADRLLGYTVTLMPLLEELCAMAEEVAPQVMQRLSLELAPSSSDSLHPPPPPDAATPDFDAWLNSTPSPPAPSDFHTRAESLRHRLSTWRPTINDALPFRASRKFRAQAASYRAGALLYLHRLQNPPRPSSVPASAQSPSSSYFEAIPGVSLPFNAAAPPAHEDLPPCDAEALCLAHDIMLHASGPPPAETKLLLWPVFLAACEMRNADDRGAVGDLFDSISTHRGTVTVERTRRFVEERVWRARDAGGEWNWMGLAQRYPGECLPI